MLTNSIVGAIFFCISIASGLFIFIPWGKFGITKMKHIILVTIILCTPLITW